MSDLKESVQAAINAYVHSKTDSHTPVDVLRMIRLQAELLYERQLICDALDADPMEQLQDVKTQIARIQNVMEVVSSTRVETLDGYTRNHVVVEFKRDNRMKDVATNVQLTFHYEKRLQQPTNSSGEYNSSRQSHIMYIINVGKDYAQKERLLTIEVWALGVGPSEQPPTPLEDGEWEDMSDDDKDAMDASIEDPSENDNSAADRYAAYMDPDALHNFLSWTQLDMNEYTAFMFLMTFPCYEHEWDLASFVLDTVFGESIDEDEDEDAK